ncbi:MAG: CCA tRNA nucleotidyltransferase [Pseudomonadota bacterium]
MKVKKTINIPDSVVERFQPLFSLLNAENSQSTILLVGGCVRNLILNEAITDIDMATTYTPAKFMSLLEGQNIKVIPTGIDHGTVTALLDNHTIEITTLRKDVQTDGRHADVAFTDQWEEDAARRDFTMNALYMDLEGNVFDPTGQGLQDIEDRTIKFIGDAEERIQEDYLRILRFFRFHAYYGAGDIDSAGLEACKKYANKISSLSRERITQEFFKILYPPKVVETLDTMFQANVLTALKGDGYNPETLEKLVSLQDQYKDSFDKISAILSRYFILSGARARFHDDLLIFSKVQAAFIVKLENITQESLFADEKAIKKAMFYHGRDLVLQGYLLLLAQGKIKEDKKLIDLIQTWNIPECPITGETLLAEGYKTGPELGRELELRQEEWLEENV